MRSARQVMVPVALAAIFAAPMLMAWAVYRNADWHPHRGLQHGELLLPLQPLNASIDPATFRGRWTLLYHSGDHCAADCRQLLAALQRVRLAQGQAMARVQRVLVLTQPPGADEASELADGGHDLRVVSTRHWPLPPAWVYLLDPQGNMVMRYRPGFEPRGLLKDLQRLLKQPGSD